MLQGIWLSREEEIENWLPDGRAMNLFADQHENKSFFHVFSRQQRFQKNINFGGTQNGGFFKTHVRGRDDYEVL